MDAKEVKALALELGADLVGIASAATLNAFPPDPRWPPDAHVMWLTSDFVGDAANRVVLMGSRIEPIPVAASRGRWEERDRHAADGRGTVRTSGRERGIP